MVFPTISLETSSRQIPVLFLISTFCVFNNFFFSLERGYWFYWYVLKKWLWDLLILCIGFLFANFMGLCNHFDHSLSSVHLSISLSFSSFLRWNLRRPVVNLYSFVIYAFYFILWDHHCLTIKTTAELYSVLLHGPLLVK